MFKIKSQKILILVLIYLSHTYITNIEETWI